jgi:hypothetical protein
VLKNTEILLRLPKRPVVRATVVAVVVGLILGLPATVLSAMAVQVYGLTLFVGVPLALGFVSALLYSTPGRGTPIRELIGVAWLATLLLGAALILIAAEGLICLVMAWPLVLGLAAVGAVIGRVARKVAGTGALASVAVLALPGLLVGESAADRQPPLMSVRSSIVIAATPELVWRHVIRFPELDAPRDIAFRLGVAYPIGATIEGRGVGAIRRCRFSTGDFVEPITVWEPGRRLAFSVSGQPEPMHELSPYDTVHAPHLHGYLESVRGEFLLERVPGGTRLTGTTWYRNRMWPTAYWRLWSDGIIHRIHRRVLRHIKVVTERDASRRLVRGR